MKLESTKGSQKESFDQLLLSATKSLDPKKLQTILETPTEILSAQTLSPSLSFALTHKKLEVLKVFKEQTEPAVFEQAISSVLKTSTNIHLYALAKFLEESDFDVSEETLKQILITSAKLSFPRLIELVLKRECFRPESPIWGEVLKEAASQGCFEFVKLLLNQAYQPRTLLRNTQGSSPIEAKTHPGKSHYIRVIHIGPLPLFNAAQIAGQSGHQSTQNLILDTLFRFTQTWGAFEILSDAIRRKDEISTQALLKYLPRLPQNDISELLGQALFNAISQSAFRIMSLIFEYIERHPGSFGSSIEEIQMNFLNLTRWFTFPEGSELYVERIDQAENGVLLLFHILEDAPIETSFLHCIKENSPQPHCLEFALDLAIKMKNLALIKQLATFFKIEPTRVHPLFTDFFLKEKIDSEKAQEYLSEYIHTFWDLNLIGQNTVESLLALSFKEDKPDHLQLLLNCGILSKWEADRFSEEFTKKIWEFSISMILPMLLASHRKEKSLF